MSPIYGEPTVVREKWESAACRCPSRSNTTPSAPKAKTAAACRETRFPTALRSRKRPH